MQEILKAPTENLNSWRDYLDSFSTLLGTEFESIYKQFVDFMTKLENATKGKAEWDALSDYDKVANVVSSKNLRFGDYSRWGDVFKIEGVLDAWRNLSDDEKLKLKMSSAGAPSFGNRENYELEKYKAQIAEFVKYSIGLQKNRKSENFYLFVPPAYKGAEETNDVLSAWNILTVEQKQKLINEAAGSSYATGTTSASGGLSMVGENGPELRVLNRGDGIIPSSITKNLWEMGKNPYKFTDKSGGNNITFTGNLSFPNVTDERDAQAFIDKVMQISVPRMR